MARTGSSQASRWQDSIPRVKKALKKPAAQRSKQGSKKDRGSKPDLPPKSVNSPCNGPAGFMQSVHEFTIASDCSGLCTEMFALQTLLTSKLVHRHASESCPKKRLSIIFDFLNKLAA